MHELAVCQALLDEIQRQVRDAHAGALSRIVLRVGPLSGVEPQLLSRAFDVARIGSAAECAELQIESGAVRIQCLACDAQCETPPNRLVCDRCGGWRTRLLSGDELILQRLEFRPGPLPGPSLH